MHKQEDPERKEKKDKADKTDKNAKQKTFLQKAWHFIWDDDSVLSWIVNIVLAFILIKFIVYPGIGLVFGTTHPVVAVVSGSMDHRLDSRGVICGQMPQGYKNNFDSFWDTCGEFYRGMDIDKPEFEKYIFRNGFNKGDIIVLFGAKPENIKEGDVIVFASGQRDPIIHRVVKRWNDTEWHFQTKGDHNAGSIDLETLNEVDITKERIIGRAVFRIPFLGNIKIWFVDLLKLLRLDQSVGRLFN